MSKDVIAVECIGGFKLSMTFEGGEHRTIDISDLVPWDGVFEPLEDAAFFRQVRVEPDVGTIVWPNGADFDPATLHDWPELLPAMEARAQQWRRVST